MGVLFSRKQQKRQIFPIPPIAPYPGGPTGGFSYDNGNSSERSLRVPVVWACVKLLADTVSILPLETYEAAPQQVDGVARKVANPEVIKVPEPGRTQSEWIHCIMVSLLLRGNAYGLMQFDNQGRPTEIVLLHPDLVRVNVSPLGELSYTINKNGTSITLPRSMVWHLRGLTLPGSFEGMSPIAYAAATIGLDMAARDFAGGYFSESGMPKAVITHEAVINQAEATVIKDRVLTALNGREPLVMGGGVKFTPISIKPEESQFLETQNASVAQISRYFGVPPEMVGGSGSSSMTYANVEQRSIDFLTFSVQFWLKRIEDSCATLLPSTQITKFDVRPLLRTSAEDAAKVDNMRVAGKIMTPDEIRARYNLPPLTPEQIKLLDLVPMIATPLGGMKGLPPEIVKAEALKKQQDQANPTPKAGE